MLPSSNDQCGTTLVQDVTQRLQRVVGSMAASDYLQLVSVPLANFNTCMSSTMGESAPQKLKWLLYPGWQAGVAVDVLRLALGVTGMSGRYELGAPDTLPPPGSLRSGADVRDLATRTNSEYAFVVQDGSGESLSAFLSDTQTHVARASVLPVFNQLPENSCASLVEPRGPLHPRTYLLLFYRADALAALAAAGRVPVPGGSAPPSDWYSMLSLLEAHAAAVAAQAQATTAAATGSNSTTNATAALPRYGLCVTTDATCGRLGDLWTAIAASTLQTRGPPEGYAFDLTAAPPAAEPLVGGAGWRHAAAVLQALLRFAGPPDQPDAPGQLACGAVSRPFADGDCLMTVEWDAQAPALARQPVLARAGVLGVAPLPGSRVVVPPPGWSQDMGAAAAAATAAAAAAATAAASGPAAAAVAAAALRDGLVPCSQDLCAMSSNHDLLYLQTSTEGAVAAAAAAAAAASSSGTAAVSSVAVLAALAAREAAAAAWLRQQGASLSYTEPPLVNRAPYSAAWEQVMAVRYVGSGSGVLISALADVVALQQWQLSAMDSYRAARQNATDTLRRALLRRSTGTAAAGVNTSTLLSGAYPFLNCSEYKAADWWRLLATSSSSSSSNTGGGGSWGPDARPLAAAAGLTDPAAASALLRAVWHALHSPNAAPDVQSPVPMNWWRYGTQQAAQLLLPPSSTAAAATAPSSNSSLLFAATSSGAAAAASSATANSTALEAQRADAVALLLRLWGLAVSGLGDESVRATYAESVSAEPWPQGAAAGDDSSTHLSDGAIAAIAVCSALGAALLVLLAAVSVYQVRAARRHLRRDLLGRVIAPKAGPDTTLLITDVQNSTGLWECLPSSVMDVVLKLHHSTIRSLLSDYDGYESATEGDSFILAFAGPAAALDFATACQVTFLKKDWPQPLLQHPDGVPVLVSLPYDPRAAASLAGAAAAGAAGGNDVSASTTALLASLGLIAPPSSAPARTLSQMLGGAAGSVARASGNGGFTPGPGGAAGTAAAAGGASFMRFFRLRSLLGGSTPAGSTPAPGSTAGGPGSEHHSGNNSILDSSPFTGHAAAIGSGAAGGAAGPPQAPVPFSLSGVLPCGPTSAAGTITATGMVIGGIGLTGASRPSSGANTGFGSALSISCDHTSESAAVAAAAAAIAATGGGGPTCSWCDTLVAAFPVIPLDSPEGRRLAALVGAMGTLPADEDGGDGDGDQDSGMQVLDMSTGGGGGSRRRASVAADSTGREGWGNTQQPPCLRLSDGRLVLVAYRGLRVRMGLHTGLEAPESMTFNKFASAYAYGGKFAEITRLVSNAAPGGLITLSGAAFTRLRHARPGAAAHVSSSGSALGYGVPQGQSPRQQGQPPSSNNNSPRQRRAYDPSHAGPTNGTHGSGNGSKATQSPADGAAGHGDRGSVSRLLTLLHARGTAAGSDAAAAAGGVSMAAAAAAAAAVLSRPIVVFAGTYVLQEPLARTRKSGSARKSTSSHKSLNVTSANIASLDGSHRGPGIGGGGGSGRASHNGRFNRRSAPAATVPAAGSSNASTKSRGGGSGRPPSASQVVITVGNRTGTYGNTSLGTGAGTGTGSYATSNASNFGGSGGSSGNNSHGAYRPRATGGSRYGGNFWRPSEGPLAEATLTEEGEPDPAALAAQPQQPATGGPAAEQAAAVPPLPIAASVPAAAVPVPLAVASLIQGENPAAIAARLASSGSVPNSPVRRGVTDATESSFSIHVRGGVARALGSGPGGAAGGGAATTDDGGTTTDDGGAAWARGDVLQQQQRRAGGGGGGGAPLWPQGSSGLRKVRLQTPAEAAAAELSARPGSGSGFPYGTTPEDNSPVMRMKSSGIGSGPQPTEFVPMGVVPTHSRSGLVAAMAAALASAHAASNTVAGSGGTGGGALTAAGVAGSAGRAAAGIPAGAASGPSGLFSRPSRMGSSGRRDTGTGGLSTGPSGGMGTRTHTSQYVSSSHVTVTSRYVSSSYHVSTNHNYSGATVYSGGHVSRVSRARPAPPPRTDQIMIPDHAVSVFVACHPSLMCRLAMAPPLRSVRQVGLGSIFAPVRTVTIAFMKVVGASALLADLPVVAARAMDAFVRIAAGMLPECGGGYVVEGGAGGGGLVLAAFASPSAATSWALSTLAALRRHPWEEELLAHEQCGEELAIGGALTTGGSGAASPTAAGTTTAMSAAHHMGLIVEASGAQAQSQTRGPLQARSSSLGPRTFSVLRSQDSVIHSGPRVKVGLDIGPVAHTLTEASGRLSYRGRVMNRAARIASIGAPGQVLVSGDVWEAINGEEAGVRGAFTGVHMGTVSLKGVTQPVEVVQVLPDVAQQQQQ